MLTTSLSQDLYKRFVAPRSTDAHILGVARGTTVVAGAIGTALAIVSPTVIGLLTAMQALGGSYIQHVVRGAGETYGTFATVIGLLTIFYTLLGVSLFVPILGGLYVAAAGTAEALAAIAAGVGTMLAVHVTTGGAGYGVLTPALTGFTAATVAFFVVLAARRGYRGEPSPSSRPARPRGSSERVP